MYFMKRIRVLLAVTVTVFLVSPAYGFQCNVKCTEKSVCAPGDIPCIIKCSKYQGDCCREGADICADRDKKADLSGQPGKTE